jgi:hypothetical protein
MTSTERKNPLEERVRLIEGELPEIRKWGREIAELRGQRSGQDSRDHREGLRSNTVAIYIGIAVAIILGLLGLFNLHL